MAPKSSADFGVSAGVTKIIDIKMQTKVKMRGLECEYVIKNGYINEIYSFLRIKNVRRLYFCGG